MPGVGPTRQTAFLGVEFPHEYRGAGGGIEARPVREFLGKTSPTQATSIEPSVLRDRIDRLTEGYNKNVEQVTGQILSEEQAAGKTFLGSEQQPHIDAANRLRA